MTRRSACHSEYLNISRSTAGKSIYIFLESAFSKYYVNIRIIRDIFFVFRKTIQDFNNDHLPSHCSRSPPPVLRFIVSGKSKSGGSKDCVMSSNSFKQNQVMNGLYSKFEFSDIPSLILNVRRHSVMTSSVATPLQQAIKHKNISLEYQ